MLIHPVTGCAPDNFAATFVTVGLFCCNCRSGAGQLLRVYCLPDFSVLSLRTDHAARRAVRGY